MADDLSKRDFRDKPRINTKQKHEFGVSGQQWAPARSAPQTFFLRMALTTKASEQYSEAFA
jgi:hypothetical protein